MTHDNKEERVVHVFERRKKKMDPKDVLNATPFFMVITMCIGALMVSIAIGFLEKRTVVLMEKLNHANAINSYRDKVKVVGVKFKNSDDTLTISGGVRNTGRRAVTDIGITVFFLDKKDTVISQESFTSTSPEGSSLTTNKKRNFVFSMPNPPDDTEEIRAVISDIKFSP